MNQLKIKFDKKENELIKLEEDKTLIVQVPNTSKKSFKKIISKILIFIGSLLIICNRKKVTR